VCDACRDGKAERINRSFVIAIVCATSVSESRSSGLREGATAGRYQVVGEVVDLASLRRSLSSDAVCFSWTTTTPVAVCVVYSPSHYTLGLLYIGCTWPTVSSDFRFLTSKWKCLYKCDGCVWTGNNYSRNELFPYNRHVVFMRTYIVVLFLPHMI